MRKHTCIYNKKCWCGAVLLSKPLGQRVRVAGVGGKAGYPIESDSLGVHPSQTREAYEESVRLGVPTQFDKKGCAILTSATHRRDYARALGYHDRRSFGGISDA